jgi:hypothetical protein
MNITPMRLRRVRTQERFMNPWDSILEEIIKENKALTLKIGAQKTTKFK